MTNQFHKKKLPQWHTHPLHNKNETKSVTSISSRSRSEAKSVTFDDEEGPITSFQQRLKQFGTPPQVITSTNHQKFSTRYPSSLQQHSNGGRGSGTYAYMEEEGVEDEAEEDHFHLKNTPNTDTEPKAQQHWKPKKILPSPTQKNLKIWKTK